jgi:Mce-associated membrane protein
MSHDKLSTKTTDGAVDTMEEPEASDGEHVSKNNVATTDFDITVESDADIDANTGDSDADPADKKAPAHHRSPTTLALVAGLVILLALGGLAGWLGYRFHQSKQAAQQRAEFVQVARQGAINLTTIDWQHIQADVQRILDTATGTFYDDFSKRSGPFIDVVKQVQSKSEGTVSLAGLEAVNGDQARVLVAVSVKTTNAGAQEPSPRAWRMRIDVQKVGNDMKVSNVEFVP